MADPDLPELNEDDVLEIIDIVVKNKDKESKAMADAMREEERVVEQRRLRIKAKMEQHMAPSGIGEPPF